MNHLRMEIPSAKKEKLANMNRIIDAKRFNNYLKLIRVPSYIMKQAEPLWVKTIQHDVYNWKKFKQLNLDLRFFIKDDALRRKRRISKASLLYDWKKPIYLLKCNFSKF